MFTVTDCKVTQALMVAVAVVPAEVGRKAVLHTIFYLAYLLTLTDLELAAEAGAKVARAAQEHLAEQAVVAHFAFTYTTTVLTDL